MDTLTIIFVMILIIALTGYLIYRNYDEYSTLENFTSQSSLSIYQTNNIDKDLDYKYTKLNSPYHLNSKIIQKSDWNGIWLNEDSNNKYTIAMVQINNVVILTLTQYRIVNVSSTTGTVSDSFTDIIRNSNVNTFLFMGKLNIEQNSFVIQKILYKDHNGISNLIDIETIDSIKDYMSSIGIPVSQDNEKIDMSLIGFPVIQYNTNIDTSKPLVTGNLSIDNGVKYLNIKFLNTAQPIVFIHKYSYSGYTHNGNTIYDYPFMNEYIKDIAPFVEANSNLVENFDGSSTPTTSDNPYKKYSYVNYTPFKCPTGKKQCKINKTGIDATSYTYNNLNINGCCDINSVDTNSLYTGDVTNSDKYCYYNLTDPNSDLPRCPKYNEIFVYNNHTIPSYLMNTENKSLKVCKYLDFFTNNSGMNAILCYVTDLTNIQTLNYQYFGLSKGESSLTLQYDITQNKLNTSLAPYKSTTTNKINSTDTRSFFNKLELSSSFDNDTDFSVNDYIKTTPNTVTSSMLPCLWDINYTPEGDRYNLVNSCPFTLSTASIYNTQKKYVNCNDDGTINLSMFGNGSSQNLYMQDFKIISNYSPKINATSTEEEKPASYYAITTNIRTNNGLYLVPSNEISGFGTNSSMIKLSDRPEINGKWLILGFPLNRITDIKDILTDYVFRK